MVILKNVNKYFNRHKRNEIHIINNTSLEFDNVGLVALLGESGSGKTTLLNAIGGLDKVNKGKIYINGKKITHKTAHTVDKIRNLNIGYIFQDYKLIDNLTVFDNVAIALKMIGIKDKKEIEKRVNYVLESVNMYRYRNRPANMLSGGERQRVAIARAIVKNPNIVIADEPTGNLDSKNSLEIMNIIKAISKDKLVILVTHETELAKFYASRIIEIKDGKVEKDYKNDISESLDYRVESKIYLKDFKNIDALNCNNVNIDVYSNDNDKVDIKLVVKKGNIYIQSENKKIEVVDDSSAIELINEHYQKIDKSIYQENKYDLENVIDKNIKTKSSSIYGLFKSIIAGIREIADYSVLRKILLVGFFAASMFIVYSVCNMAGMTRIEDTDFITMNKNYLQADMAKISVDNFLKIEKLEEVDYVLPGDSFVNFKIRFDDYYQTSMFEMAFTGSLVSLDVINETNLISGRMPENEYEIIVDKKVIDDLRNSGTGQYMGIQSENELLNKKVSISNLPDFTIVGFVDEKTASIYAYKSIFIDLLNCSKIDEYSTGIGIYIQDSSNIDEENKVFDYNRYLDDIEITKGRMPTNDYEVIVNKSNQYEMKLNKTIPVKVNEKELKVVGYYESKTNRQDYLVNSNTVKYDVISKSEGITIYPKNEDNVIQTLENNYGLDVVNRYETDKENYINSQKESRTSSIILAGIILGISLIEIYLMMRSSFLSRIKEVGVLRAIGVKKTDIYKKFLGEIIAITTCAGMPGVVLMTYVLWMLSQNAYIAKNYVVNVSTVGISILITYAFNIIVGLIPLFKVLRKTPAKILSRHDIE